MMDVVDVDKAVVEVLKQYRDAGVGFMVAGWYKAHRGEGDVGALAANPHISWIEPQVRLASTHNLSGGSSTSLSVRQTHFTNAPRTVGEVVIRGMYNCFSNAWYKFRGLFVTNYF